MNQIIRPSLVRGSISTEQWDVARPLVQQLYIDENKSFSYVAEALKSEYGFYPTKPQFDRIVGRKWRLRKNTTVQQRRLAVEQLSSGTIDLNQVHPDVRGIIRPLNVSKLKRWEKNLGKKTSLRVEDEPLVSGSVYVNNVLPELQDSEQMQQFDLWNCTRVNSSPDLTALFVTFDLLDLGPPDVDVSMISLFEHSGLALAVEEHQCISSLDLLDLQIPTQVNGSNDTKIISCSYLPTHRDPAGNLISTHDRHRLATQGWIHTWYIDGFCQRELYPFKSISNLRHVRATNRIHELPMVLEDKLEKLIRLFPTKHDIILFAMAELRDEYVYRGDKFGIVSVLHKLVSILKHAYGVDHPRTLYARLDLIDNLNRRGLWQEAADKQSHIHKIILVKYSLDYRLLAKSLALLSKQARVFENYEEAEQLKRQVLQINLNMHGVKHKDTLEAMRMLGSSLTENGSFSLAEKLLRVTTQVHHYMPELPAEEVCRDLTTLARCLGHQKMFSQAFLLIERALAHAKHLPGGHPQLLGMMHHLLARYKKASCEILLNREVIYAACRQCQVWNRPKNERGYRWQLGLTL